MSLQDVLYKLSKIESAVDNINTRLCSLESNLSQNNSLRSINSRIPRNIFYSPNLQRQSPGNINQTNQTNQVNANTTNTPLNNNQNNETPLNHNQNDQQEQTYIQPSLFSYFNTRNPRRTEQIEISLSNPGTNLFDTLFPELNRRSERLQDHRTINQHTELSVYFNDNDSEDSEDICTICQEAIQNNSITRKIKKCNHFFHSTCLDKWLENHITCPTCRQDITTNTNNEETNGDSASVNDETTI